MCLALKYPTYQKVLEVDCWSYERRCPFEFQIEIFLSTTLVYAYLDIFSKRSGSNCFERHYFIYTHFAPSGPRPFKSFALPALISRQASMGPRNQLKIPNKYPTTRPSQQPTSLPTPSSLHSQPPTNQPSKQPCLATHLLVIKLHWKQRLNRSTETTK